MGVFGRMRRRSRATRLGAVAVMAVAAGGFLGCTREAKAEDAQVNFKFSVWLPPSHPVVSSAKGWLSSLEKASGGSIKGTVFPAEQLGKAFDHYDMAREGIADVTYVSPGYQPGRFPVFDAAQLPFVISDGKKGTAAVDAWYRHYAGTEMKDTHFCLAFAQDPGALHAKKKILLPDEIRGMKIRPANAIIGQYVTVLGGTNVQASAAEARDVLERGVADAITFPWNSLFLLGVDRVTKFHMDIPLYASSFVWVMNKAKYEGLSDAQKKAVDNHCNNEWAQKVGAEWADFELLGRVKARETAGHTVYALNEEQLKAWRQSAEPLRAAWADGLRKAGGDPDAVVAELKTYLDKYQTVN
jgi:TRAP-type transport system periplasmic protein